MRIPFILFAFLLFSMLRVQGQVPNPLAGSGYCIDFDGSGDYVEIPVNSALAVTQAITVEGWIYCRNIYQWESFFAYAVDNGGNESGYDFGFAGGKLRFRVATVGMSNDDWNNDPGITVPLDEWVHVAGTFDGSMIKVYRNGVLQEQRARPGPIDWEFTPLEGRIGCYYDSNEEWFWRGKIDELRIWNVALTEPQIQSRMCQKIPGNSPGLVACYRLDEASGIAVQDISLNNIPAIYHNGLREFSGAPLGDFSTAFYTNNWTGVTTTLNSTNRGNMSLNNIVGTGQGLHIYAVNSVPNSLLGIQAANGEKDYYWGTFVANGTLSYRGNYVYTNYGFANANENLINIFERSDNADPNWILDPSWTQNATANSFTDLGLNGGRHEYILATGRCTEIINSSISGPSCSGNICQVCPGQNIQLAITDGTNLPAGGQIKWYLSADQNFDPYKGEGLLILSTLISNAANPFPISGQFALNTGNCGDIYYIKAIISPHSDTDPYMDNGSNCETTDPLQSSIVYILQLHCPQGSYSDILCAGQQVTIGNMVFDENNPAGQVVLDGAAAGGCDSIVDVFLDFIPPVTEFFSATLCPGQSIVIGSTVFDQNQPAGMVLLQGAASNGCDSIVDVQIQFYAIIDTTIVSNSSCDPNAQDNYQVLQSSNGCDSVVFTQAIYLGVDTIFLQAASCLPADTGVFVQHLTSQGGCDSVVVSSISLSSILNTFIQNFSCNPLDTGTQIFNLQSTNGCDSIVSITTDLWPSSQIVLQAFSCNPSDTGVVQQALVNQYGCDSLVTTTTSLLPSDIVDIILGSCNAADTGFVMQMLVNQHGCDSLVNTYTQLFPTDITLIQLSSCNPSDTGLTTMVLSNHFGCDSTVITDVNYSLADSTFLISGSCVEADTGHFTAVFLNQFGCDSIVLQTVALLPQSLVMLDDYTCFPADTGMFQQVLVNQYGCDSTIRTQVLLLRSDSTFQVLSSCNPLDTGTQIVTLINSEGCDSNLVVTTLFSAADTMYLALTSCFPADTGFQEQHFQNQFGCDSLILRQVTLSPWSITLADSTSITLGDSVLLQPQVQGGLFATFSWKPSDFLSCDTCLQTWANPIVNTLYHIQMTDDFGCFAEASILVKVIEPALTDIFIPGGFSPDGDGQNDVFTIYGDPAKWKQVELQIFNRWGDQVYGNDHLIINHNSIGWDGKFKGKALNSGVFVYQITLSSVDGSVVRRSGSVVLTRL